MWLGGVSRLLPSHSTTAVIDSLIRDDVTVMIAVPAVFSLLVRRPPSQNLGLRLALYGGAPIGTATVEALQRMIQYAFDELEVDCLVTHNAADWRGQIEPLRKLGMRKTGEGIGSFSTNPDGKPNEFLFYTLEITGKEWSTFHEL